MAIVGLARVVLGRAMVATVPNLRFGASVDGLVNAIMRRPEYSTKYTRQEIRGVAQQVVRAVEAGNSLQRRPTNPLARSEIPIDPQAGDSAGRYLYRVHVQYQSGDGGSTFETVVDLESDDLLTRDQATAYARQMVEDRQLDSSYRTSIANLGSNFTGQERIISVGRRQ